ncbi:hypothetical protein ACFPOA_03015 [Lysobacter niabensis]|uniref:hypothetical protein n=1 Tax=Agrilutibacter niabensis TaxID=380628 RepID=UPI00362308BC
MFGRWFQRSLPVEDRVWTDAAARTRGLRADVERALDGGAAALLLLRSQTDEADFARELVARSPVLGHDRFAADDLQAALQRPGALGVCSVDALRPLATTGTAAGSGKRAPLQVHVLARDARRSADRKLLDLLTPWTPARVVFHHSLDDALLRTHATHLQPLLQKLGLAADEAIASPLLTRAIERAQRP